MQNLRHADGPMDPCRQNLRVDGLGDVIKSPVANGLYGSIKGCHPADHDHRDGKIEGLNPLQEFDSSHARHTNIRQDKVNLFFFQQLESALGARGHSEIDLARLIVGKLLFERAQKNFCIRRFVLD